MTRSMATLELRPASPADEAALARFAAALPPGEPARAVIGSLMRYAASHASGLRAWVAAGEAGGRGPERIAAFAAARGVPALWDGGERAFAELLCVAAHPEEQGSVRCPRLLVDLVRQHLDAHCTLEGDLVTYGLASEKVWRLLRPGLGVEVLRRPPELVAELPPAPAGEGDLPDGVREVPAFDGRVRALYERCARAWRASCVRDAATLAWRFPAEGAYRRIVVGGDGEGLAGLAVAAPDAHGRLAVLDWLLPDDEREAGELLHLGLVRLAHVLELSRIRACLPPWSPDFARFQERGFRVGPTGDFVLTKSAHPNHDHWWLRDHWWLQPFDVARPPYSPRQEGPAALSALEET